MPAEALTAVEHALLIAPDYQHAWEQLSDWAAQCGDGERATRFARELLKKHSGEPSVWLMLARTLPVSAPEERIDAAKRAVDLDRRSALAWDLWAELLTLAERFDDAAGVCRQGEAACAADAFMLSGRRAWIEAQRGRIPDAIESMREVLATNRGYSWGWYQLVYWLTQTELLAEAEAALETMRQMWPHDAWVHRQLAVLLLKRKDTEAAKAAFSKALELAPNDINAAHNLLQLQLQTSDLAGGLATLQTMQLHQPGTYTLAAEIDLRLAQDDLDSAARCLGTLATLPDPDPWPIDSAVETFQRTFHYGQAKRVLERAVRSRDANPQVAAALIRLYANAGSFLSAARLFMKLPAGEQQRRAAAPLMQLLAENDRKALFRWVLRRKADVLKADAAAWGQVGYGLTRFGMLARVADWLADWRGRDGVQPWMLFNYCLALRDVGRYSESVEVARHVIDHWAHRDGSSDMHLYLAVEAALAGAVRDARQHLERATVRENVAYDQQLLALAHALTEFHEAEPDLRGRLFPKIRERLNPQFSGYRFARSMRDARRTFVRAAEVFVREGAGPFAWMWFRWKLHWRWTYVVAPLASVGLIYNSFTQ
jgi:tetratricopeptide (TPR) repeat protein